jgi:hypothetical protein
MGRVGTSLAIGLAAALIVFGLVAAAARPVAGQPHLVSMATSAEAMWQAGTVMYAHGQAMLADGKSAGNEDLVTRGEHWLRDGEALLQGSHWLAMNPTAPGSLVSTPSELAAQGSWGELNRTAQAMLHDPSRARAFDLKALRGNGLAMRSDGQNMAEHGRVMAEEVDLMATRHPLPSEAAPELRQAAQAMVEVGGHLEKNGQAMMDYAGRLGRSIGYPPGWSSQ